MCDLNRRVNCTKPFVSLKDTCLVIVIGVGLPTGPVEQHSAHIFQQQNKLWLNEVVLW